MDNLIKLDPATPENKTVVNTTSTADPNATIKPQEPAKPASFSNIFTEKKSDTSEATVVKTILDQKNAPKMKPILGNAPTLMKSLEEGKVLRQKKTLRITQGIFVLVFFAALGMAGYFYSELSPTFDLLGPNTTAKLTDSNKNLRSAQTVINKYRYLAAQLDLNVFSLVSDDYLDKTAQMASNASKVAILESSVMASAEELPTTIDRVKENLSAPLVIKTYPTAAEQIYTPEQITSQFEADLKSLLIEDRKKITSVENLSSENEQDLRLIENTLKLVGNNKLLNAINALSADTLKSNLTTYTESLDAAKRKEVNDMMKTVLSTTKSDIAVIGALKSARVDWAWIIDKIEEVTATVDPNFNAGLFDVTGLEIVYTGYELDSNNKKIVLSGYTKTNDARNFSIISNLIDELEKSEYFETVEMRSFSKSGSFDTGFTANFKIDLNIELNGSSAKNAPVALVKRAVAQKGVKRITNNQ